MDHELLSEVKQTARKFAARHIEPVAADVDHHDPAFPREVFQQGLEAGFDRFVLPEQAGGYGFSMVELCGLVSSLAAICPGHAMVFGIHAAAIKAIYDAGSDSSLLSSVFESSLPIGVAIPDPVEADDFDAALFATQTDNDRILLSGEPGLAANGSPAGFYLVFGKDQDKKPCAILIRGESNGFTIEPPELTLGLRAMPLVNSSFERADLAESSILAVGTDALGFYRSLIGNLSIVASAAAVGLMESASKKAIAYTAERYQGGKTIIDHSHLRNILGSMSAQTTSARGVMFFAATRTGDLQSCLSTKATVTDLAVKVCTDAVQVLGGYGYMRDYGLEKAMRDAAVLALLPISNIRAELLIAAKEKSNL
ncbi:MAG: acyl-CoA/acyl-ACP dehydrogenase [Desulfobacterales bacterium]|uniref:Acyl-CoA/acyl-ACP dehydrogenase n=1 Tax=Candidatus Desulfatibia vada TaxID=2841696 RepID=A0A8J6P438_9BACT|nr:acyl-CoA/acyl-ACP dehydrogenase [Candidatus Desulfatibia vada]MBL6972223.1 acyl-CoA/acyl-ACP dehydrogenase [Desulfobacterales bacterium]